VDSDRAVDGGALILSADQGHMVDGEFDPAAMLKTLSATVAQARADGYHGLWATGDMLWEFGAPKNLSKLLAYELGLEAFCRAEPCMSGICQYHRETLPAEAVQVALYAHKTLYINDVLAKTNPNYLQSAMLAASDDSEATGQRLSETLARLCDASH